MKADQRHTTHAPPGMKPWAHKRSASRDQAPLTLQTVSAGQSLYQPSDTRRLYRVEQGALCHYVRWANGRHDVVEFAFPGDIVGLGNLRAHSSTAQAMVDSVVSLLDEADLTEALRSDDVLAMRLVAAAEREFDVLRDRAIATARSCAAGRLANYLLALAGMNTRAGHDATFICDGDCTPHAASLLQLDVAALSHALAALQKRGLIVAVAGGLLILDVAGLERFADATDEDADAA
jgi:CRP/FNR family transcriptional regulator, anaerobic regulatory protein